MAFYSRKIEMPHTRLQGLCNFVQMIINHLEADNSREALLVSVDLLDTLQGDANPFASITASKDNAMLAELKRQHMQEMVEAMAKARTDGYEAGVTAEKARMASVLGLAA